MQETNELPTASVFFGGWWSGACETARQISMTRNFQRHPTEKSLTISSLVTRVLSSLSRPSVLRGHQARTCLNTPPRRGEPLVRQWLYIHSGAYHHATVAADANIYLGYFDARASFWCHCCSSHGTSCHGCPIIHDHTQHQIGNSNHVI